MTVIPFVQNPQSGEIWQLKSGRRVYMLYSGNNVCAVLAISFNLKAATASDIIFPGTSKKKPGFMIMTEVLVTMPNDKFDKFILKLDPISIKIVEEVRKELAHTQLYHVMAGALTGPPVSTERPQAVFYAKAARQNLQRYAENIATKIFPENPHGKMEGHRYLFSFHEKKGLRKGDVYEYKSYKGTYEFCIVNGKNEEDYSAVLSREHFCKTSEGIRIAREGDPMGQVFWIDKNGEKSVLFDLMTRTQSIS